MDEPLTFRDFAAAIMSQDVDKASSVLEVLLGVDPDQARAAAEHFAVRMQAGPEFLMKAMGMRQVVEAGDAPKLSELLGELFGLDPALRERASATIRGTYE